MLNSYYNYVQLFKGKLSTMREIEDIKNKQIEKYQVVFNYNHN